MKVSCLLGCFLVGPCTWEPGQGVPGCRGGLRPFLLCSCSCLVFKRLPQEWSYLSFHLFTCTMGFAPIKWTCTAFFRPRQLTDRAILAIRQTQQKKQLLGGDPSRTRPESWFWNPFLGTSIASLFVSTQVLQAELAELKQRRQELREAASRLD